MTRPVAAALALVAAVGLAASCTSRSPLSRLTRPPSPHDTYASSLREAGLDTTALGRDWLAAAARALLQPVSVESPFRESGYFAPGDASAIAYRLALRRGRTLEVDVTFETLGASVLFVDLFRLDGDGTPQRVTSLGAETTTLRTEIDEDAEYLLRVQPELLRGGRYELVERTLASLPFPVSDPTVRRVDSGFGDPRDAGARAHEGVDIFARAGTPVVAVTSGWAQPGTNALGGIVVWLQDDSRRRSFYYAHLQKTALAGARRVAPGEIVGYVGNTGNARTTRPHLHFGVYARGALDPLPFIGADDERPPPLPALALELGALARVRAARAPLRAGPARNAPTTATLPAGTLVTLAGATSRALRVVLPDHTMGYLPPQTIAALQPPLSTRRLTAGLALREQPTDAAPVVRVLDESVIGEVLARFADFELIRTDAATGWAAAARASGD